MLCGSVIHNMVKKGREVMECNLVDLLSGTERGAILQYATTLKP